MALGALEFVLLRVERAGPLLRWQQSMHPVAHDVLVVASWHYFTAAPGCSDLGSLLWASTMIAIVQVARVAFACFGLGSLNEAGAKIGAKSATG